MTFQCKNLGLSLCRTVGRHLALSQACTTRQQRALFCIWNRLDLSCQWSVLHGVLCTVLRVNWSVPSWVKTKTYPCLPYLRGWELTANWLTQASWWRVDGNGPFPWNMLITLTFTHAYRPYWLANAIELCTKQTCNHVCATHPLPVYKTRDVPSICQPKR